MNIFAICIFLFKKVEYLPDTIAENNFSILMGLKYTTNSLIIFFNDVACSNSNSNLRLYLKFRRFVKSSKDSLSFFLFTCTFSKKNVFTFSKIIQGYFFKGCTLKNFKRLGLLKEINCSILEFFLYCN